MYADPLFTRRNFVGRDLVPFGLPMERAVHDAWARGRVPVWTDDVSGGRPLFPNPNSGSLYPARPLLSRLPFAVAMRVLPVAHWAIGGIGMLLALSALGMSRGAAWIGAVTFVFSGTLVSESFYLPLQPAATLQPWILWAMARPAARVAGRAIPLGVVFGLMLLLGDVVGVGIAFLGCVLWIAFEIARPARGRETAALVLGLVLAALLAAPQIVATTLLASQTHRAITGIPVREALAFTLSPWRLLELVVPFPFGPFWSLEDREVWGSAALRPFFATLYSGALAVVVFVQPWRKRAPGIRFGRSLVLCGAVLAIVFRFVPERFGDRPSWIPLRFPEKFALAMAIGLAVLAAFGFDRFRSGAPRPAWLLPVAGALTAVALAAALFPARVGAAASHLLGASATAPADAGLQLSAAFAEAGLLWTVTLVSVEVLGIPQRERGRARVSFAAALVLLTAVPLLANRRIARTENEGAVFPPTAFARTLDRRDPHRAYRTIDETPFRAPSPLAVPAAGDPYLTESDRQDWAWLTQGLWSRGTVLNLDPDRGDFSRVESLRRISMRSANDPNGASFFSSLGLRFGIRYPDQAPLPGFRPFGRDARRVWDESADALPDLRVLERWRETPGAVEALAAIPALATGEVVLESGRGAAGSARAGTVEVLEKTPERLRLAVTSPDPSFLFVLRGYWSYRSIRVDDREVEAIPAQLAFTAVPLDAGEHRVEWVERVPGLSVSRWGPALFLLLAAGLHLRERAA